MSTLLRTGKTLLLALLFSLTWAQSVWGTTLLSMTIDQVIDDAEFIFEGEVLGHRIEQDSASGLIYTFVTFAVHEIIKGEYDNEQLELRFTGGSANGEIIEVPGLALPGSGEQGIYFVASLKRLFVNPLLGWSQGHYVIAEVDGVRRIHSSAGEAIMAVQSTAAIPATLIRPQQLIEGKGDAAAGVVTNASALSQERALGVEEFKSRIREIMQP